MNRSWIVMTMCVLGLTFAGAQDARFTFDTEASMEAVVAPPNNVSVAWEAGALRVEYTGTEAVSVTLVQVPLKGVRDPYVYSARMKAETVSAPAYLEMWSIFADGQYFSRALDYAFTDPTDWRTCRTPFLLKRSDPQPQLASLGVRMEGPAVVWVDDLTLRPMGASATGCAKFGPYAGAFFGIVGGLWGAAVGILAPRGKARHVILGLGYALMGLSALSLIGGVWMLFSVPFMQAIPTLMVGALGLILFPALLPVVHRCYREAELRQIQAMDVT